MNKLFIASILGVAIAGVLYYMYDKKGAEKLIDNILDSATSTIEKSMLDFVKQF